MELGAGRTSGGQAGGLEEEIKLDLKRFMHDWGGHLKVASTPVHNVGQNKSHSIQM